MIRTIGMIVVICTLLLAVGFADAENLSFRIGESEHVFTLAEMNRDVRGLAIDDGSPRALRLFTIDRSGNIFEYRLAFDGSAESEALVLERVHTLAHGTDSPKPASPRGLAYAVEDGHDVFYYLNWHSDKETVQSQLWRHDIDQPSQSCVDLTWAAFRIGNREVLDLAYDHGRIFVSFDASGYSDQNTRVQRGILLLDWNPSAEDTSSMTAPPEGQENHPSPGTSQNHSKPQGPWASLRSVRHLPDSGTAPARGLACMELDDTHYLWATVGNEHVYCADAETGRGLFFFDRPKSMENSKSCWGLAFGCNALWVSEHVPGSDRVHRVNVTKNLDDPLLGPRTVRHLIMTIETRPERNSKKPGAVTHNYSRPYGNEQMPNQGIWPETETLVDLSSAPNAALKELTHHPANDPSSCQFMRSIHYASAPARTYSSRYEIDVWTNPYKKFVYPHRVNNQRQPLKGTNYLADDPVLYNLSDTKTYMAFIRRVKQHIGKKYGIPADMHHPYWAARNILEYIQDHYYYPSRPHQRPATVDYDRKHYDANPANLKIELSEHEYDQSQIIACSGTSVMVAGALRFLKIPARWLGTGTQEGPALWDNNQNGLLDPEETAPSTNGHRYTQVWLGSHYGWICFDATPTKPDFDDYDPPPPLKSQWRYMERAAAGHRVDKRLVFNVGSELYLPLYRDFEYDEKLAEDNNCGGDQRYNLQGRFENPEAWKLADTKIMLKNPCWIKQVTVSGPKEKTTLTWQLEGAWDKIPNSTVSIFLQRIHEGRHRARDISKLASAIPCDSNAAVLDLAKYQKGQYRIIIRRDADPETGGHSEPFNIDISHKTPDREPID
ncbi:MAG: transglutaminase domain-containing protein [Pirellulales bacterium]|nr:transglutaminase domain-containing protein [Pirellulales bacterium]